VSPIGAFVAAFDTGDESARHALWRELGGAPFAGPVGRVRRLARIAPKYGHPLPFRLPFVFDMDGRGVYLGDDLDGLVDIFGGRSPLTRRMWGRLFMGGHPEIRVCDVALGRTSLVADLDGLDSLLHHAAGWLRLPARWYFGWRRHRLGLDSWEVHGVKFFPPHGRYTVVPDPARVRLVTRGDTIAQVLGALRELPERLSA
jgi:hypothetical protein